MKDKAVRAGMQLTNGLFICPRESQKKALEAMGRNEGGIKLAYLMG